MDATSFYLNTSYICGNSFPQCMCVTSVKYISPTGMEVVHKMFYLNFDTSGKFKINLPNLATP